MIKNSNRKLCDSFKTSFVSHFFLVFMNLDEIGQKTVNKNFQIFKNLYENLNKLEHMDGPKEHFFYMPLNIIQKVFFWCLKLAILRIFENTSPCIYRPATLEQTWFFYKWPSISASLLAIHSPMTGGVYAGTSIIVMGSSFWNCEQPFIQFWMNNSAPNPLIWT